MKKLRLFWIIFFSLCLLVSQKVKAEEFLYLPIKRAAVITCNFCCYQLKGRCHGGIDYDVRDAGDEIIASASGTVERVVDGRPNTRRQNIVEYGNFVQIRHSNGYRTIYAHLESSSIRVHVGEEVKAGQLLGYGDNSGWSSGSHLHFEVRDPSGRKVNPYGDNPSYPNCGPNALWATCPPF
ncbi:MAG: M23 family metallopeptidase [Candidatus Bathyarchaeia archaeon]